MNDIEELKQAISSVLHVAIFLVNTGRALKAIKLCKECLFFLHTEVLKKEDHFVSFLTTAINFNEIIFEAYCLLPDYTNAIKYGSKLLVIYRECGETVEEWDITIRLADIYERQCKYSEARELYEIMIKTAKETGDREGLAYAYGKFGTMSHRLGVYDKAKEYLKEALAVGIEIGDRAGEADSYGNLGSVFQSLGEYDKAKKYLEKALAIKTELGDKRREAINNGTLGTVFQSLGEYDKAKEHHEKALVTTIEIGDRAGQARCYGNLGTVFQSLGEYDKAKEYHEKALSIAIEIDNKAEEAENYGNLGTVFKSLGQYGKAKEYLEKALAITIETGNRAAEASCYGNLGTVFECLGKYHKAKAFYEKALAFKINIGDKAGEADCYGLLGAVFQSLAEYDKAKEYNEKALAIRIEIGHRAGEAASYGNLGTTFVLLGEYDKAKEYFEKALTIKIEIGDRAGEATNYGNLGTVFLYLREHQKAKESLKKAFAIRTEIGDRKGEGSCYGNLASLFLYLGEYNKAKDYREKALAIRIEIGDRAGEIADYGSLGFLYHSLGEHVIAEAYLKEALSLSQDIGNADNELSNYGNLAMVKFSQGKIQDAFRYLLLGINKSEDLRGFLRDNDQFKVAFSDLQGFSFRILSAIFCFRENPNNALYVLELARARALADLMATQYSVETQISADSQLWIDIENTMNKENNCTCLYISYHAQEVFLWILKASGVINFRRITVNENIIGANLVSSLNEFLAKSFRSLGILSQVDCEDRSLNSSESELKCPQKEKLADLRLVEDNDEDNQDPKPSLPLLYKIIIAPVVDLLEEPEIIIVPDRALYQVPFAALTDGSGKYLSETFRIRLAPSLSTLKLIQDSPVDYHSQSGALIVGDPVVGRVRYKGRRKNFLPLPCARKEAEMIGKLLGVHPLLGECATKQVVLKSLHSVSLIHFAAHGDAQRGEIALSPLCSTKKIPREEDYLLTTSDISQVQLRAKLVVLSCCHSGCGQIRAEGVIGIARAFLGSGARSVLVALWAIEDRATEQLMRRFYEHLVRRESASESLHKTMEWMRGNGFTEVSEWAPFMLIGDNVTFDFGE